MYTGFGVLDKQSFDDFVLHILVNTSFFVSVLLSKIVRKRTFRLFRLKNARASIPSYFYLSSFLSQTARQINYVHKVSAFFLSFSILQLCNHATIFTRIFIRRCLTIHWTALFCVFRRLIFFFLQLNLKIWPIGTHDDVVSTGVRSFGKNLIYSMRSKFSIN